MPRDPAPDHQPFDAAAEARPSAHRYGEGREVLVDAAVSLVSEEGIGALSHRAVAARAGVSHGLVRHYFGSTSQLVTASLEAVFRASRILHPVWILLHEPEEGLEARLEQWLSERRQLRAFEYEVLLAARHDPQLREAAQGLYADYRSSIREVFTQLSRPVPSDERIELMMACLTGVELQSITLIEGRDPRLIQALRGLRRMIMEPEPEPEPEPELESEPEPESQSQSQPEPPAGRAGASGDAVDRKPADGS